jgi:hypothetical protein
MSGAKLNADGRLGIMLTELRLPTPYDRATRAQTKELRARVARTRDYG